MARLLSETQRHWLAGEMAHWLSLGYLSAEQQGKILECYETPAELGDRKRSLASFVLAALAALLVALAVLLFIGYNWPLVIAGWESLGRVAKVAAVLLVLIVVHSVAVWIHTGTRFRHSGEVLLFFSGLLYGAGIWLIAQALHLDSHYPDGVWWWAVGVLPLALCADTLLLHLLFASLMALWVGMETIYFPHLSWWHWAPNGGYSLLLLAAPGLVWCYRKGSPTGVAIYVALFTWWAVLQATAWGLSESTVFLVTMVGPLLMILAENHRPGSAMARPYRFYGILLAAGGLVPLSFYDFHEQFGRLFGRDQRGLAAVFDVLAPLLVVAVVLVLASLLRRPRPGEDPSLAARVQTLLQRQWAGLAIAVATVAIAFGDLVDPERAALPATIAANVLMVVLALWMMHVGLRDEVGILFAGGVLYFLFWSIVRYADLFSSAGGMLGASAMFFFCGMVMLLLSIVWRKRKEIRHV